MDKKDFRKYAHELVDWMADYLENVEQYPVKSQVVPKEIFNKLPELPPTKPEQFKDIFEDFQKIIIPGMTHWQHPSFFAYFPANSSPPSILGEMLTSTLAAQCMVWQTSPAAAELEEKVMDWLKIMLSIPQSWSGVIQDTASTATLVALLSAREKKTDYLINQKGFAQQKFRIYCSSETHSSIDKAVKIAGFGIENLVKIEVNDAFAMIPEELEKAISQDIENGLTPLCVIVTLGTTSTTAIDPLDKITEICQKYSIWVHVDAALAGSALVLDEMKWMIHRIELADSFVFNPHKWMLTNFDCSAYFVKDTESLIKTFEIMPEYLKTNEKETVNNYRDWGIPLGRRFRALKLWFVIRSYGIEGIQAKIRNHIKIAEDLEQKITLHDQFELLVPRSLNLLCFRYVPDANLTNEELNNLNQKILETLNASGKLFITHTKLHQKYTLRMQIGQTEVTRQHVDAAWELIKKTSIEINSK